MHDIKFIRDHPEEFDAGLARRGHPPQASAVLEIDAKRRALIAEAEAALAERNAASKEMAKAKKDGDDEKFDVARAMMTERKGEIAALETEAKAWDAKLTEALLEIPNLPLDETPDGADEAANVEARRWGTPRDFDFTPQEHYPLAEAMGLYDPETAARLSGSRFMLLKGALSRLHRALASFMLDTHVTENGLTEIWTPSMVRDDALIGTGQLPKFADDLFKTTDGRWLIPTAEVTLTNLAADQILDEDALPWRFAAWTACYRAEAGSAGRDVAGILRQHQFEKVEMVSITTPEESRAELDRMTDCAEGLLRKLEIPFRTMALCTGDMGFGARMTYDIEVWLPGQDAFREISSCSVCGDFQARRMNARCRKEGEKKTRHPHTLNGSGLAVGRALIAVLENGQARDGSVTLPEALQPYLGGAERITADGRLA